LRMSHFKIECSCGTVISQCRCIGERNVTVIENGCSVCHKSRIKVYLSGRDVWTINREDKEVLTLTKDEWTYVNSLIHKHYHGED